MYKLSIEKNAAKELDKINLPDFDRIVKNISGLSQNPRPDGCRKLKGMPNDYRLRVGDYRIVYEIDDKMQIIRIMRIKHRKDVYKSM